LPSLTLVLLRHGQSAWNLEQRFTGWTDVALTPLGECQARAAGEALRDQGLVFDAVWTSELQRARRTADLALATFPVNGVERRSLCCLNERNFGILEGLKYVEAAERYGEQWGQPWLWGLRPEGGESLEDLVERVSPFLEKELRPAVMGGRRCLVVAHGNVIRALDELLRNGKGSRLDTVPAAVPLIYRLEPETLSVADRKFLEVTVTPKPTAYGSVKKRSEPAP
jgi:2,3-bisphosphoglycerate-dependent phosphoglycerate mutase